MIKRGMVLANCLIIGILLALAAGPGLAAEVVAVACPGQSLNDAVSAAPNFATINVTGTCNEQVSIGPGQTGITIDCGGTGTISRPVGTGYPVVIEGRRAKVSNCTISGGTDGVMVLKGAMAALDGITVQNASRFGIIVVDNAFATVTNSTIQNSGRSGVAILENGTAYVGFSNPDDTTASPNTIDSNGENGIAVAYSATAFITGNVISNNGKHGIEVGMVSHAAISANDISGNTLHGISVGSNSGLNLGNDTGTSIFDQANTSTKANRKYGIACQASAYVDGRKGTIRGVKGKVNAVQGCTNGLIP